MGRNHGRRAARLARAGGVVALLALAGCGWQPVYGGGTEAAGPAAAGLSQTAVALIPERSGQMLRQALQARFDRGGGNVGERYQLAVTALSISGEPLAIQRDNTTSRVRVTGVAPWSLVSLGAERRTLTSGQARAVGGYDVIDQQYFASDMAGEAVQRRIVEDLAEQITLQVAMYFRRHPDGG